MMRDPVSFDMSRPLRVRVFGTIEGKKRMNTGKSVLHVFYKASMIVPTGNAHDDALTVLPIWAQQWRAKGPSVRTIVTMPVIKPQTGAISPKSYDALITAMTSAAKASPHGIIALAIGHGDGGSPGFNNPWCDFAPEDGKVSETEYIRGLFIDDLELRDGEPVSGGVATTTPGDRTKVKLDALDRCAGVFKAHPIRVLLLHTCSAGASTGFMQRFANRVRVFLRAHTQQLEYTGNKPNTVVAAYEGDTPGPNAKTEWPVAHVTDEFAPQKAPKRFGPP